MQLHSLTDLESLISNQGSQPVNVAVVKAADEHVLDCVVRATIAGLIRPILIDSVDAIRDALGTRLSSEDFDVVDCGDDAQAAAHGVRLVREGTAGVLMKGLVSSGVFLKPVVNSQTGIRVSPVLSHVMLVDNPVVGRVIAVTDGGMVVTPGAKDYEPIIAHAVQVMRLLGVNRPKVALLSAAENVISKLASAQLQADFAAAHAADDLVIEGPLSIDLALLPQSAAEKGWRGRIRGDADVVVGPDIVSANVMVKSLAMFGGGTTAGVVLGAAAPIVLVSRSSSSEEKYLAVLLARLVGGAH